MFESPRKVLRGQIYTPICNFFPFESLIINNLAQKMKRQKSITKVVEAVRELSDADMIAICTLLRRLYNNRSGEFRVMNDTYIYETHPTLIFEDEINTLVKVL